MNTFKLAYSEIRVAFEYYTIYREDPAIHQFAILPLYSQSQSAKQSGNTLHFITLGKVVVAPRVLQPTQDQSNR